MSFPIDKHERSLRQLAALTLAASFQTACVEAPSKPGATADSGGATSSRDDRDSSTVDSSLSDGQATAATTVATARTASPAATHSAAAPGSGAADAGPVFLDAGDGSVEGMTSQGDGGADASTTPVHSAAGSGTTASTHSPTGSGTTAPEPSSPVSPDSGIDWVYPPLASCIHDIFGTYVLRADGIALLPAVSNPQVVLDARTARPLAGITDVMDGAYHGCAVLDDGTVDCWQEATNGNAAGQLGNGTTAASSVVFRATPVMSAPDTPLANVVAFAEPGISTNALNTTCAVTDDGKLWCWGDLAWIVNKGTALGSPYAQAITLDGIEPLTGVKQAAFGTTGACAVIEGTPNTVWCWGHNGSDQLGQGNVVDQQYPIKVLGLDSPTRVVVANSNYAENTVCAQDSGGVRCWGDNVGGSAGINTTTNPVHAPTPVVIQNGTTALTGVTDLKPGTAAFSALRTDGTLWSWGYTLAAHAANYGVTNVLAIGYAGGYGANGPRYLTSDGLYHSAMTVIPVNCGVIQ